MFSAQFIYIHVQAASGLKLHLEENENNMSMLRFVMLPMTYLRLLSAGEHFSSALSSGTEFWLSGGLVIRASTRQHMQKHGHTLTSRFLNQSKQKEDM